MASYRDKLPAAGGGAVIKSIQRGSATINSSQSSVSITVSPVATSKAVLLFSANTNFGASFDIPAVAVCSGRIAAGSNIVFYRNTTASQAISIEWQVIEYETGVSVQRGNISAAGAAFNATIINVDLMKSYLISYCSPAGNDATAIQAQVIGRIASSTSLYFGRTANFGPISIDWQVVSYV